MIKFIVGLLMLDVSKPKKYIKHKKEMFMAWHHIL